MNQGRDAQELSLKTPKRRLLDRLFGVFNSLVATLLTSFRALISTLLRKGSILVILALLVPGSVLFSVLNKTPTAHAAPSTYLNFQGRLLSNTGSLVPDGYYNINFKIYNIATDALTPKDSNACTYNTGTADPGCVWIERYYDTNGVTAGNDFRVRVTNGYFSVQLGSQTAFGAINWDQQLWLVMNIGGSAQTATPTYDGEMAPRIQLTAVPLAFIANNVKSGATSTASTNSNAVSIQSGNATGTTSNSGNISIDAGTATGTAGTISLGATNASSLILGRAGLTTLNSGSFTIAQNLTVQGTTATFGTTAVAGSLIVSDGSSSTITLKTATQVAATNYDITVPAITANDTICLVTLANCSGSGATSVGTLDTATTNAFGGHITAGVLYLQSATATLPGLVNNSTQTFAGVKTFNNNITLAAAASLQITGDVTANRPGSPTEGQVWYDTTTKQLITYQNGKWQSSRASVSKIVASTTSPQYEQDAADYLANGENSSGSGTGTIDGDQIEINSALTAVGAAGGGTVYLTEGTYQIDAAISIPNNVTLAGSGAGTLIQLGNFGGTSTTFNAITNTTTGGNGTRVGARDFRLDGRNSINTSGTQNGLYMNGVGSGTSSAAKPGAKINNVWVTNFLSWGIFLDASANSTVTGATAQGNSNDGILINSGTNNTIIGSVAQGNTASGIAVSGSSTDNTVTGNTTAGNGSFNIWLNGSSTNTITGNAVNNSGNYGIYLNSNSNNNEVSGNILRANAGIGIAIFATSNNNNVTGNKIQDTGGTTNNYGIWVSASDFNSITNNDITDSSCTTNCYAINLSASTDDKNYLSGNHYIGSAADAATINDAGTNTIYGNQQNNSTTSTNSDVTDFLFRGSANSATAFAVQNASGSSVLNVNTTTAGATIAGTFTSSGGTINLNASSSFATNINTGTGNGNVNILNGTGTGTIGIGNSAAGAIAIQSASTIGLTGTTSVTGLSGGSTTALTVNSGVASNVGLLIQGASSQTANLLQILDSTSSSLLTVDASGNIEALGIYDSSYGGFGPSKANLIADSSSFNTGNWTSTNITSVTNGATTSNGLAIADTIVSSGAGSHTLTNTYTTAVNGNYNFSVWLKTNSATQPIQLRIDSTGGTPTTGTAASFTATITWQRFNVTQNFTGSPSNIKPTIVITNNSATVVAWGSMLITGTSPAVFAPQSPAINPSTGATVVGGLSIIGNDGGAGSISVDSTGGGEVLRFVGKTDASNEIASFGDCCNASFAIGATSNYSTFRYGLRVAGGLLLGDGTSTASGDLSFATGADRTLNVNTAGAALNGNALTVAAGAGNGTNKNGGALNLNGGANTGIGTVGAVNINTSINGATNINTGTSTGAVSIGNSLAGAIAIQSATTIGLTGAVTLTNNLTVQGGTATLGTTAQAGSLIVSDGSSSTVTFKSATQVAAVNYDITVPAITANDTICLVTLNNCATGATTTLQAAYDADANGSDVRIDLTTADGGLIFSNPSSGGSASAYVLSVAQVATGAVGALDVQNAGTGLALSVASTNATQTGNTALVSSNANGTITNGLVRFNFTGVRTTAGNGLQIDDASTTLATAAQINATSLTTGIALGINAGNNITSGSAVRVNAAGTTAIATNGLVSIQHTGAFTGTGGLLNIQGNSTTAGTIASITGSSLTSGTALTIAANTGTALAVTSGKTSLTGATSGSATALTVNNSTSTGSIFVAQDNGTAVFTIADGGYVTLAAGKALTVTGDTTANRPGSPVEGMIFFDTTTKSLITYSNGKWQGDRAGASRIVAASNSSQFAKDAADYVANGEDSAGAGIGTLDGDQIEINNALTAVSSAGGGTVYLMEGTYTVDASISIPNNVTLAGSGNSSLIQLGNFGATLTNVNAVVNSDTSTGTGVKIRDLKIDGRTSINTNGTYRGVFFNGMGGGVSTTARQGGLVTGVYVKDFRTADIGLSASNNNTVSNSTATGSGNGIVLATASAGNTIVGNSAQGNTAGIQVNASTDNTVSSNTFQGNTSYDIYISTGANSNTISGNTANGNTNYGIYITSSSYNTVTGNTTTGGTAGIYLVTGSYNTISGNTTQGSSFGGIYLTASSTYNTVTGNTSQANGSSGIVLDSSTNNSIIGNQLNSNTLSGLKLQVNSNSNLASNNYIGANGGNGLNLTTSNYNTISGNVIDDSNGLTLNNGLTLTSSDFNSLIGNTISDPSCTSSCAAIYISDSASDKNYLQGNRYTGSAANAANINDLGTNTIYSDQQTNSTNNVNNDFTDIRFRGSINSTTALDVENSSGTSVLTVDTTNSQTILRGVTSDAVVSASELVTSQDFTSANWTTCNGGAGGWTGTTTTAAHNTGNVTTCTAAASNFTVVAGATYQISFTIAGSGGAPNSVTPNIGGVNGGPIASNGVQTMVIKTTTSGSLIFTPNTTFFNGTISAISVKQLTTLSAPVLTVQNSGGTATLEVRSSGSTTNLFMGLDSGRANTSTGTGNTAVGNFSLQSNTTGTFNTALGYQSLAANVAGGWSTAIGYQALKVNYGNSNTAVGSGTLIANTSGVQNVAVGTDSLGSNTVGGSNVAVGNIALFANTSGVQNTAIGYGSLTGNTSGFNNVAIGNASFTSNITGSNNTVIGFYAGKQDPTVGTFVTLSNLTKSTAIGYGAQVQASSSLILGGADTNAVNVGIGTTAPSNILSVSPVRYSGGTAGTAGVSTTTVTGSGTLWVTNGVLPGDEFIFADGTKRTVVSVSSETSLVVNSVLSEVGTNNNYRIHYMGLQVKSDGTVFTQGGSTTQFSVLTGAGTGILTVDSSTTTSSVKIGVSDTTGTLLVLDTKTTIADPTGVAGGMYYNSSSKQFRCYENGSWENCVSGLTNQDSFWIKSGGGTTGTTSFVPVGTQAPLVTGTTTSNNSTDAVLTQVVTTAAVAGTGGYTSQAGAYNTSQRGYNPSCSMKVRTAAALPTGARVFVGLISASPANANDSGGNHVGFRYSTVAGDTGVSTGWRATTRDGTTNTIAAANVGASANIAVSTTYSLKMRFDTTNATVYMSVNGGTEDAVTATLPAAATSLGYAALITSSDTNADTFNFGKFYCEQN